MRVTDQQPGHFRPGCHPSVICRRSSIVDMRQELRAGNRSMFSRALAAGLRHVLAGRTAGDPLL